MSIVRFVALESCWGCCKGHAQQLHLHGGDAHPIDMQELGASGLTPWSACMHPAAGTHEQAACAA